MSDSGHPIEHDYATPEGTPVPPSPPIDHHGHPTLQSWPEDKPYAQADLASVPSMTTMHSSKDHPTPKYNGMPSPNSQTTFAASHREFVDGQPRKQYSPPLLRKHDRTISNMTGSTAPYAEHGALIDRTRTGEKKKPANAMLTWPRYRRWAREAFSEYLGTFILIMFGDGVVAQVVLSNGEKGSYQSISWGWGIGVMLGVYTSGISGAHINPAVTFANCVFRKFPWKKFPVYALAQILGAMTAAAVVYGNYKSAIDNFEGGAGIRTVPGYSPNASAGIFCTYPAAFMSNTGQFFSEFIASTLLMFLIYALKDDGNIGAGNLTPLGLFFIIFGIGACWGWETGYAINLARDFGPRLVSYMVGYGPNVWRAGSYYFWVPMVAPFCGCTFGGFLYDLLIFTGESPINTPYLGFYRFIPSLRRKYEGVTWKADGIGEKKDDDSPPSTKADGDMV